MVPYCSRVYLCDFMTPMYVDPMSHVQLSDILEFYPLILAVSSINSVPILLDRYGFRVGLVHANHGVVD